MNGAGWIDAHVHVWDLDVAEYPWLTPELAPLDRTHSWDDARKNLTDAGAVGAVLVQAADNDEDTAELLRIADSDAAVRGIVGYIPLHEPAVAERRLETLIDDPRLVGIRNLTHDRPDPAWLLRSGVDEGVTVVERAGLPLDVVTSVPEHLRILPTLAGRHPDLTIVLDHLGKPPVGQDLGEWRSALRAAAQHPRVHAKISGLYGGRTVSPQDELAPIVDWAIECFGPDRLMLGSDWPMSELHGGAAATGAWLTALIEQLSPHESESIRMRTATTVYGLAATNETDSPVGKDD